MPRIEIPPIQRSVTFLNSRQSRPAGCTSTLERWSGMLTRPWIRSSSCRSCCSLTELAVGFTCWAVDGAGSAVTSRRKAHAPIVRRMNLANDAIGSSPIFARPQLMPASGLDRLAIGGLPAPRPGAVAALHHAFFVNLGDDFAVAGEQGLGRAHFGA